MTLSGTMPEPCPLCGERRGIRHADGWRCGVCTWRCGDVPDSDLPRPRVDIVYYIRFADRVKIGTSNKPRQRLSALWHDELLAFERGNRTLERVRHEQFADLREGGEWFTAAPRLLEHAARLADGNDPWHAYARWVSAAFAPHSTAR